VRYVPRSPLAVWIRTAAPAAGAPLLAPDDAPDDEPDEAADDEPDEEPPQAARSTAAARRAPAKPALRTLAAGMDRSTRNSDMATTVL
jgi:hypothetical protein